MSTTLQYSWLSVGGLERTPSDLMGSQSRQVVVKDEVAVKRAVDPVQRILDASHKVLAEPAAPKNNEQSAKSGNVGYFPAY
ncbi:hypothetical protein [Bordetella sp. H567]|uniref:hypothetical protein n=1 Tax=Bordetella sp. H567 TaxID=1697043 RepID=UPI0011AB62D7|nr:hypothetical protein [Bordetella sp. H567]